MNTKMTEETIRAEAVSRLDDGAAFVAVVMRTDDECLFGCGVSSWRAIVDAIGHDNASEFVDQCEQSEYRWDADARANVSHMHDGWEDRCLIFKR